MVDVLALLEKVSDPEACFNWLKDPRNTEAADQHGHATQLQRQVSQEVMVQLDARENGSKTAYQNRAKLAAVFQNAIDDKLVWLLSMAFKIGMERPQLGDDCCAHYAPFLGRPHEVVDDLAHKIASDDPEDELKAWVHRQAEKVVEQTDKAMTGAPEALGDRMRWSVMCDFYTSYVYAAGFTLAHEYSESKMLEEMLGE